MSATRSIYKVVRSLIFSVILTTVGIFAAIYILVSLPFVQNKLRSTAEHELTQLLGGKVEIGEVQFFPFNELRLNNVSIYTPSGERCISAVRLGAGIDIWKLITDRDVEISYAEVVALNALVEQKTPHAPFNISFIIDALKTDRKKEPSRVKIILHNVVIRKSSVSFRRDWKISSESTENINKIDFNNLMVSNLNADLEIPYIQGDSVEIKMRRLAFTEKSGLDIKSLSFSASVSPNSISLTGFGIKTGSSHITVSDQRLDMDGYNDITDALYRNRRYVEVNASPLYPSDFKAFLPQLTDFVNPCEVNIILKGTPQNISIELFDLNSNSHDIMMRTKGDVKGLPDIRSLHGQFELLELYCSATYVNLISDLAARIPDKIRTSIQSLGDVKLSAKGSFDNAASMACGEFAISTACGDIEAKGEVDWPSGIFIADDVSISAENVGLGVLTGFDKFGSVSLSANGDIRVAGDKVEGNLKAELPYLDYNGHRIENIATEINKTGNSIKGMLEIPDAELNISLNADITLNGADSQWNLNGNLNDVRPFGLGIVYFNSDEKVRGRFSAALCGDKPDNMRGSLSIYDAELSSSSRPLSLDKMELTSEISSENRSYELDSDWIKGELTGNFNFSSLRFLTQAALHNALPVFFKNPGLSDLSGQYADLKMNLFPADDFCRAFNLPLRPLAPVAINAEANGDDSSISFTFDAPYLVKGKDKLIKNSRVEGLMGTSMPFHLDLKTAYPVKHDIADFLLGVDASNDDIDIDASWSAENNPDNRGAISMSALMKRNLLDNQIGADIHLSRSEINLNGAKWNVSPANVRYSGKRLDVEGVCISHGTQFITIDGSASSEPLDVLTANLAGIDLQYIFDLLNINHVDFGGIATGKAMASGLFSGSPIARTHNLRVKDFAYNGCVLGDADLYGDWSNTEKKVGISADVVAADTASVKVRGGVYVTRDSLSFDFDAHKANLALLRPFVAGFTSSITGKASGHVKLFGTFSEIDLAGSAHADTVTMKVDHTNVSYSGSDSIFFSKGRIDIPSIRLYDIYGNSARFSGNVRHNYLKDASFDFELNDARNLLVFDTDTKINPLWNGRIFASGNAKLKGTPGVVALDVKMSTDRHSVFNITLDDTRTATEYSFLTFSDKGAEVRAAEELSETAAAIASYEKSLTPTDERPGIFTMDLSIGVNQYADLVLIMDPATGDRIRANGNGALQMHYDTETDDYTVYGKYILDRGTYNFSLQDLILKNFTIRTGSSISFNGDPMNGLLDITAAYRVNTNLADLDPSFKDDPDLKRTIVPVDALLKVTGDIHAPEINFDINLPTVTSEVERKLHSIISTEDMLNRQVIYLLALNRFYSPSYAGAERGGELASAASSTLSSQIQNIIGSLTDKVSLAPSIKSDRSDLSDMEFDLALSSRLFDNRLLINGNLGYRDKSTSQTTFIGDFDIEYLLTANGQLRLKAYNHFNDASYYLKSALTTQGIGVMYRKEFDDPFSFLKHKKKRKAEEMR